MRLGLHKNGPGHSDLFRRYVEQVRPPVVKVLADAWDPGLVDHAHAHGTRVVARRVEAADGDMQANIDRTLAWGADRGWTMDWLEWANEESQGRDRPEDFDRLCRYALKFLKGLDGRHVGTRGCVLNCSTGQPELERWTRQPARELLAYCATRGHAIGLHEYYRPVPWQGVDGRRGWWMLRVQRAVDIWRLQGASPNVIVTESGRDAVSGTPGDGAGWRDAPGDDYAAFMGWYCEKVSAIREVIGVVDFGFDGTPRWESFDLAAAPGELDRMAVQMRRLPIGGSMSTLNDEAAAHQVIRLNPAAALQKAARDRGFWPTSGEWTSAAAGNVPAQRYEDPGSGQSFVALWKAGRVEWHALPQ